MKTLIMFLLIAVTAFAYQYKATELYTAGCSNGTWTGIWEKVDVTIFQSDEYFTFSGSNIICLEYTRINMKITNDGIPSPILGAYIFNCTSEDVYSENGWDVIVDKDKKNKLTITIAKQNFILYFRVEKVE
jgi:hypothetical protein